jgi:hypothetical protein
MTGYNTVLKIRRLEEQVDKLGFRMAHTKHGNYRQEFGDVVALFPKDHALPIYSRDAEMFVGTLDQLEVWLRGLAWAREYDRMLRMTDDKRRTRYEQRESERIATMRRREEQRRMLAVLKASDTENSSRKKVTL